MNGAWSAIGGAAGAAACLAAAAAAFAAAAVLPRLAERTGWVDRAGSSARKLQRRPVAPVGGAIALLGLGAAWAALALLGKVPPAGRGLLGIVQGLFPGRGVELWPVAGLLAAFGVGLADDLRPGGLGAGPKLAGQAAAGLLVAAPLVAGAGAGPGALPALAVALCLALGAVVATNAVNTFDNADGSAGLLVALAAVGPAPELSAALLPFLALNLRRRRDGEVAAYLGDSGSHLLGLWILVTPAAWPALVLPLADLLRLSAVRWARGSRPWRADRLHLAHRLLRRGVPRVWVPVLLCALALPTLLWGFFGAPWTLALFALALACGDRAEAGGAEPGAACPGPRPGG